MSDGSPAARTTQRRSNPKNRRARVNGQQPQMPPSSTNGVRLHADAPAFVPSFVPRQPAMRQPYAAYPYAGSYAPPPQWAHPPHMTPDGRFLQAPHFDPTLQDFEPDHHPMENPNFFPVHLPPGAGVVPVFPPQMPTGPPPPVHPQPTHKGGPPSTASSSSSMTVPPVATPSAATTTTPETTTAETKTTKKSSSSSAETPSTQQKPSKAPLPKAAKETAAKIDLTEYPSLGEGAPSSTTPPPPATSFAAAVARGAPDAEAKKKQLEKKAEARAQDDKKALEAAASADKAAASAAASAAGDANAASAAASTAKKALDMLLEEQQKEAARAEAARADAARAEAARAEAARQKEAADLLLKKKQEEEKAAAAAKAEADLLRKKKEEEEAALLLAAKEKEQEKIAAAAALAAAAPKKASLKKKSDMYEKRKTGGDLDAFVDAPPPQAAVEEPAATSTPTTQVTPESPKESLVADNWEEGALSASKDNVLLGTPKPSSTPPGLSDASSKTTTTSYAKTQLLEIRRSLGQLTEPPADMLPFVVEKGSRSSGAAPERRRLGPGGSARASAGSGAGGGGSSRDYGRDDDGPPRRGSARPGSERHGRNDRGGGGGEQWARGQRVKGNASGDKHGDDLLGLDRTLQTTAYRWDPKKIKKDADATEKAVAAVTSILNKMTPENFEKLSNQLANLEMISSDVLQRVVGTVFDKAVDEPHFAVVYAELCHKMILEEPAKSTVWPFIRCVKDDELNLWSACSDVDVLDSSPNLMPLENLEEATELLRAVVARDDELLLKKADDDDDEDQPEDDDEADLSEREKRERARDKRERRRRRLSGAADAHLESLLPETVGIGQLELKPVSCLMRQDRVLCLYTAPQRPGIYFSFFVDASQFFDGPALLIKNDLPSEEEAEQAMMKTVSFRRILLNKCQREFEKVAKGSGGALALAEMAREAMREIEEATKKAKDEALAAGLPAPVEPEPLTHKDWVVKLKRRMLGIVRFIGELFKQSLLKEKIMYECIKLLLGPYLDSEDVQKARPAPDSVIPDDESIEAACKLFLTIGRKLEELSVASKNNLEAYFAHFNVLSRDKRLQSRTRFMLQDLAEVRRNGWRERRAKDGPHKLGNSATTTTGNNNNNNNSPSSSGQAAPAGKAQQQQQQAQQQRELARQRQRESIAHSQDVRRGAAATPAAAPAAKKDVRILSRGSSPQQATTTTAAPKAAKAWGQPGGPEAASAMDDGWPDEKIANRVRSTLDEYGQLKDEAELLASFDEMPRSRGATQFVKTCIEDAIDGKAAQRETALASLGKLLGKGARIAKAEAQAAVDSKVRDLPDRAMDAPKAFEHAALVIAMLLASGVVDVAWPRAERRKAHRRRGHRRRRRLQGRQTQVLQAPRLRPRGRQSQQIRQYSASYRSLRPLAGRAHRRQAQAPAGLNLNNLP